MLVSFNRLTLFAFLLFFGVANATSPEEEIIIVENFISPDVAQVFIQYFIAQKGQLQKETDNIVPIQSIHQESIKNLFLDLSRQVLDVLQHSYPVEGKELHLDHAGIFARIPPNYAAYHSDNIRFSCPIHGQDQSVLRATCDQSCPGSKYVPNHTSWREYTGLLYLNDDFAGGEIVFEDGPCNKIYRKTIPIKAGMLVLSPNGPHFYHETIPMRKGTRYSIHLWYTSDPRYHFP